MGVLVLLFSAMIHDYNHVGYTNQYLIETSHPLAITYNDQSVLENMHVAEAFKVLKKEDCNFMRNMTKEKRAEFRELVIDTVFKTDMKFHSHVVYDLNKDVNNLEAGAFRQILRRCTVHLADISHPTRPNKMHVLWSKKITEEFYHQGDMEKERGIPHQNTIFDRTRNNMVKAQIGFIDFIVKSAFKAFVKVVPAAAPSINYLEVNSAYWTKKEVNKSSTDQRRRESRLLLQNSIRL